MDKWMVSFPSLFSYQNTIDNHFYIIGREYYYENIDKIYNFIKSYIEILKW